MEETEEFRGPIELKDKFDVDIETLHRLHSAVRARELLGQEGISLETFKTILAEIDVICEPDDAACLFAKIDWASRSLLSWTEISNYIQLELTEKQYQYMRGKRVEFSLPPIMAEPPYHDATIGVALTSDGLWITCSQEATFCLWSRNIRLKRFKDCQSQQTFKSVNRKWITCVTSIPQYSKIVAATMDRQLQFFDMHTFSPHCQISGLAAAPLDMRSGITPGKKTILLFGDQHGCVTIIKFHTLRNSLRNWKKMHKHPDTHLPTINVEQALFDNEITLTRWAIHKDWVKMVCYYPSTDQIISCSNDQVTSLAIGNRRESMVVGHNLKDFENRFKSGITVTRNPCDQIVFKVTKGVSCFDFCHERNLIATGGTDRMVRLWDCFLNKLPTARLWGHFAPVKSVFICNKDSRLYSISVDKWIKVWDLEDQTCLLTLPANTHRLRGALNNVMFSYEEKSLALLGDNFCILRLKQKDSEIVGRIVTSHKEPVTCIRYNSVFNQIISACEGSIVKIWDVSTGRLDYTIEHVQEDCSITCMTFDTAQKRLITVGTDGTGRIWNHNNGCLIRKLKAAESNSEVSTVTYVDLYTYKFILTAGWSHRLNRYVDNYDAIPFELPAQPYCHDDIVRGHRQDILCSVFCPPDAFATGDIDGNVLLWSVDSGYRTGVLKPPSPKDWEPEESLCGHGNRDVTSMVYLKYRATKRRTGALVTGGPFSHVHIWNIYVDTTLFAQFPMVNVDKTSGLIIISALDSDAENQILVAGDSRGYVTVWDMSTYALQDRETTPPNVICFWQAHLEPISGIQVVSDCKMVVSSSADATVRLWTYKEGRYIGTFGQPAEWLVGKDIKLSDTCIPFSLWGEPKEEVTTDNKDDLEESLSFTDVSNLDPAARKRRERYDIPLAHFARRKAAPPQNRRHLNDEKPKMFSCIGSVAPYHALRYHNLESCKTPLEKPEGYKISLRDSMHL